ARTGDHEGVDDPRRHHAAPGHRPQGEGVAMNPMSGQLVSRVSAVAEAALLSWLASTLGLEVTGEQRAGLEAGAAAVGMTGCFLVYCVARPMISRYVSPVDSAEPKPDA